MDWQPKQLFTALQAAAAVFSFGKQHAFLKTMCFCQYMSILCVFAYFRKHKIDVERSPVPTSCRVSS